LEKVLDADGNDEISAEEIDAAVEALKTLDKDGNGKLTRDELRPLPPPDGPPEGFRRRGPREDGRRGPPPRDRAPERRPAPEEDAGDVSPPEVDAVPDEAASEDAPTDEDATPEEPATESAAEESEEE
jgi:hypothetical protein